MYKCKHFKLYELVTKSVYDRYGEQAWQFFDSDLLKIIDWLREKADASITINNWFWGGDLDERGLRDNLCDIVTSKTTQKKLYLSAHVLGKAVDLNIAEMTAEEARQFIIAHADELPCTIRLEKKKIAPTWVHLDLYWTEHSNFITLKK